MVVLRLREAAEETGTGKSTMWRAIESGYMSAELTEEGGAPNASLRQLPTPETIATNDLAAKLSAADAAISNIQELLGMIRTSHEELRQTLDDLKRDRDEWRGRAERRAAVVAAARGLTDGPSYRARDRAFPDLARPTSSSRPRTQRRLLRIETNPLDVNGAPFAAARAGLRRKERASHQGKLGGIPPGFCSV